MAVNQVLLTLCGAVVAFVPSAGRNLLDGHRNGRSVDRIRQSLVTSSDIYCDGPAPMLNPCSLLSDHERRRSTGLENKNALSASAHVTGFQNIGELSGLSRIMWYPHIKFPILGVLLHGNPLSSCPNR